MPKDYSKDSLPSGHPFAYETIMQQPKQMPQVREGGLTYEILHTGGFIKLYTLKGRLYWSSQASFGMIKPDWKIHFAVARKDIPKAWDILAKLFMESHCEFGMKVRWQSLIPPHHGETTTTTAAEEELGEAGQEQQQQQQETNSPFAWSNEMWGREITVYCYTHDNNYDALDVTLDDGSELKLRKRDQKDRQFWKEFMRRAEKRLTRNGVREIPMNPGDKPFGAKYASLRNEAFIKVDPTWGDLVPVNPGETDIYPPNIAGYNGANHDDWLSSRKKRKQTKLS